MLKTKLKLPGCKAMLIKQNKYVLKALKKGIGQRIPSPPPPFYTLNSFTSCLPLVFNIFFIFIFPYNIIIK